MLTECVIETGDKFIIQQVLDKYYDRLKEGRPCFLYNEKQHRIGQIFDVNMKYETENNCKLIATCEIWKSGCDPIFDKIEKLL